MYKRTGLVSFTLTALALAMASERLQAADIANIEHVDVVGQAAAIDQALKEQRSSDSIKSVVHADGVAQLPDENVAEAVQRLPGVSVERDQGEGRFVSVRGLGPDLNSVTINGTLVPSPESERRAVALDVLPSELVQSLSVIKTLTPDMDANSLGGTVDVKSLSAFDHKGMFYTGSTEASYDKNTRQTSPKFSGAASNRFSLGDGIDNFGVAAALSWQKRDFGSDNVETGGAWDFSQGAKLSEFEQRDYDISRERAGGGLNFDYKPDDLSSYYLRTLYSRYTDTETRNAASLEFADPQAPGEGQQDHAHRHRPGLQPVIPGDAGGQANEFVEAVDPPGEKDARQAQCQVIGDAPGGAAFQHQAQPYQGEQGGAALADDIQPYPLVDAFQLAAGQEQQQAEVGGDQQQDEFPAVGFEHGKHGRESLGK